MPSINININFIYVAFSIILFSGALLPLFDKYGLFGSNIYMPLYQLLAASIYLLSLTFFINNISYLKKIIQNNKIILGLLSYSIISILFSSNPNITLIKASSLVGTTLFGFYIYKTIRINTLIAILLYTFLFLGLVSLLWVLVFPEMSIHGKGMHYKSWMGIFAHKNILAKNMVFGSIISAYVLISDSFSSRYKLLSIIVFTISLLLLLFSTSKTGLIVATIVFIFILPLAYILLKSLRFNDLFVIIYIGVLLFLLVVLIFVYNNFIDIIEYFGGNNTLTGRTLLWPFVFSSIINKPIFGYGYRTFWDSSYSYSLLSNIEWAPTYAHNGYLDLLLDFGLCGSILFLFSLIYYMKSSWRALLSKNENSILRVTFLSFIILYAITGTTIVAQNSISWIFFIYLYLYSFNDNNYIIDDK